MESHYAEGTIMDIHLIWAQDRKGAIGRANTLPWHLPEDLRRFKELTTGHPVIMGRKTFDSLPNGPLPNRQNIVLSRAGVAEPHPGVVYARELQSALQMAGTARPACVYVIGGAQVYQAALRVADRIDLTLVDLDIEDADAFAPAVPADFRADQGTDWLTSKTGLRYQFQRWVRPRR